MFYFCWFKTAGSSENFTRQVQLILWFVSSGELSERHRGLERRFKAFVHAFIVSATTTSFVALVAEEVARVRRAAHEFARAGLLEPFSDGFLSLLHKKERRLNLFAGTL